MVDDESWAKKAISLCLAAGLLVTFGAIVWFTLQTYDNPPRLADPAPTAPPTRKSNGALPQQYRAAYDPNARLLGVLAIVTPLLTTVVGFYFGQRAGVATGHAAKSEARKKQAETASALFESGHPEAVQVLRTQGLLAGAAAQPDPEKHGEGGQEMGDDKGDGEHRAGGEEGDADQGEKGRRRLFGRQRT